MPSVPHRLLLLRPDAYGDLVLFEPVLRVVRHFWPEVEIAVLIRESCQDIIPLLDSSGVQWLTTACNPYRETPGANPVALAALRETVRTFAPDCLVAACAEQTWLEAAVASFLPEVRQISLGRGTTDPVARAALDVTLPVDWTAIYPEKIDVELELPEWEKNLQLASTLLGREVPRWWPVARVPESATGCAAQILAEAGLSAGGFVACAAAGTVNVPIKSWPAEHYGDILAWLQRERGIRALLVGHASEGEHLAEIRRRARASGADPAVWVGQDGEMPVLAGLLAAAGFYLGNDTGALHLAAALTRPVVPVFGGGTWPRFRPLARRSAVVVQPLPCFGCGWNCYFGDAPCLREIPTEAVRRALEWLLASDEDAATEITVEAAIPSKGLELIRKTTAVQRRLGSREGSRGTLTQKALSDLFKQLDFSESDRVERLETIEKQGEEISRLHAEIDRLLKAAEEFWPKLDVVTNERNLFAAQFKNAENDRAVRLELIERLGAEGDAAANERNLLAAQLADLRGHFENSEADRAARLEVINSQGAEIARLHAEVSRWRQEAGELGPRLEAALGESELRTVQWTDLRAQLERKAAESAARVESIEEYATGIDLLRTQLAAAEGERGALRERQQTLENHWAARLLRKIRLWPC